MTNKQTQTPFAWDRYHTPYMDLWAVLTVPDTSFPWPQNIYGTRRLVSERNWPSIFPDVACLLAFRQCIHVHCTTIVCFVSLSLSLSLITCWFIRFFRGRRYFARPNKKVATAECKCPPISFVTTHNCPESFPCRIPTTHVQQTSTRLPGR